jgi:hypothetical protein
MTLDSSGNLGIGTASPGFKLDVQGSATDFVAFNGLNTNNNAGTITSSAIKFGFTSTVGTHYATLKITEDSVNSNSGGLTISLPNGGVETPLLALTSAGNLGIGTTSPSTKLDVRSGYITSGTASSNLGTRVLAGFYTDGALSCWGTEYSSGGPVMGYAVWPSTLAADSFVSASGITIERGAYTISANNHRWYIGASQTVSIGSAVSMTQAMTLSAAGNLGLGTASPADSSTFGRALDIQSSTGAAAYFRDSDDTTKFAVAGYYGSDSNAYYGSYGTGTGTLFLTSGTERARIDSSGNFLIGTTAGSYRIQSTVASGADRDMFLSGVTGVSNGVYWKWVNSTSKISVYFSALPTTASAANAYIDNAAGDQLLRSTSSIRYKKDIENIDHEFADAALNLRPVWYRSKADSDNKDWSWYGLIAEEVAEVEPRLVHWAYPEDAFDVETVDGVIKKTVKEGAERIPDGVQYERLSVLLLDIVKRQNARIETLEAKVAALEAK